jgi:hypothetical protein
MRGMSSASLGPWRVSIIVRRGAKRICARGRALCAWRTTPLYRVERRVIAGFIQDVSRAASRHFPAANSTRSSVYASNNGRSPWLTTRPSSGSPHCTQITPHRFICLGKRRIYYISNDTANAGPPAGPRGVRPGPLSRLVNLRGISGSALRAKAASRRCYLEK